MSGGGEELLGTQTESWVQIPTLTQWLSLNFLIWELGITPCDTGQVLREREL